MAAIEFALCDEDRERFGGPEWVSLDFEALNDAPFDVLDPVEQQLLDARKMSLGELVAKLYDPPTLFVTKASVWVARQLAGQAEPPLADFNIKARKVRFRTVKPAGAAVPPSQPSSEASSEAEPSATV